MNFHQSVFSAEVLEIFKPTSEKNFIDCTLGHGGHSKDLINLGSTVLGIDLDSDAIQVATTRINNPKLLIAQGNYCNFLELSSEFRRNHQINGILFDLGLNISQYKDLGRGFSFDDPLSLDMRLDPTTQDNTVENIVNTYSYEDLVKMFSLYSQELLCKPIAQKIIQSRRRQPIKTGKELSELISQVYAKFHHKTKIHPATKVFMALRIEVNSEYQNIKKVLQDTLQLNSGCIVIFISFHSGEDRIIKNFIKRQSSKINALPSLKPSHEEIKINPLSRSAILRSYTIK